MAAVRPGSNTKLEEDRSTVLSIWLSMGGTEATLKNDIEDDPGKWKGVKVAQTIGGRRVVKIEWPQCGLKGNIPKEIWRLSMLDKLDLWKNELTGEIPEELGLLGELTQLDLGNNKLEGSIPGSLGKLDILKKLILRENLLTGILPDALADLNALTYFGIKGNNLSGDTLPPAFEPMMKRLGVTGFYSDFNKDELYLNRAKAAIKKIQDSEIRRQTTELQDDILMHVRNKDAVRAEQSYVKLKRNCDQQAVRLGKLTFDVLLHYRFRDNGHRYKQIGKLANVPQTRQQLIPALEMPGKVQSKEEIAKVLLSMATWREKEFQDLINGEIVEHFDNVTSVKDICGSFGIEASIYEADKFGNAVSLTSSQYALEKGTGSPALVKARFGPPKSLQRALAKFEKGFETAEAGGSPWFGLRDLNRCTLTFEDPLLLSICYEGCMKKFKVAGLKSTFEPLTTKQYKTPPQITMYVDLGDGWLCELVLIFRDIQKIKDEIDTLSSIKSTTKADECLIPLFARAPTMEETLSAEVLKLKQSNHKLAKGKAEADAKLKKAEDEVGSLMQELDMLKGNIMAVMQQSASPMRSAGKPPPVPPSPIADDKEAKEAAGEVGKKLFT